MMKAMKTDGSIVKCVYSKHALNPGCKQLVGLLNVRMHTTDQHIDAIDARVKKDIKKTSRVVFIT